MIILDHIVSIAEIGRMDGVENDFVKGVVDLRRNLIALNAEMHYELAEYLKHEKGSDDIDLWGFNLWLDNESWDDVLEFDSLINIHNNQMHGYVRGGLNIQSPEIAQQAKEVITGWITM